MITSPLAFMQIRHLRALSALGLFAIITVLSLGQIRAETGNRVTINSDKVLVINGKKVFPIGFTMGPLPDAKTPNGKYGLEELADAGGTFIRTGTKGTPWDEDTVADEEKWENAAARAGLYCWVNLRELSSITGHNTKHEALLRRVVEKFKGNPGLCIWKGEDEPQWGGKKVGPEIRAYQIIRELDTNHPVVIMQAPRGTVEQLKPYIPAGDITGADIYPIGFPPGADSRLPNKEISVVGDYTKRMNEVCDGKQPVWMVLQIAWSGVVQRGKTLRFPTFPEERFMSYQAIIDGARGIVYFGGNVKQALSAEDAKLGWNWRFWDRVLRPVMEEIGNKSPLEPALVAPDSTLPVKLTGATNVEFCVRECGPDIYLLACKREGETVQVKFSDLPAVDGPAEVMFEPPRTVEVSGGKFTDWFAPFDVHIYHFRRKG